MMRRRAQPVAVDLVPGEESGRVGPVGASRYVVPSGEPERGPGLAGSATPRVRQHAGDAAVVAYALAVVAVCAAVVLVAAVFGVAAYRVVAWMWPS